MFICCIARWFAHHVLFDAFREMPFLSLSQPIRNYAHKQLMEAPDNIGLLRYETLSGLN